MCEQRVAHGREIGALVSHDALSSAKADSLPHSAPAFPPRPEPEAGARHSADRVRMDAVSM